MGVERNTVVVTTLIVAMIVCITTSSDYVYADKKGPHTNLEDLGTLQLAAHDFFNVDRTLEIDFENGKLDLSTVLFDPKGGQCDFNKSLNELDGCALYGDEAISNGGELRNRESILIFSISSPLGETYLHLRENFGAEVAYEKTLEIFHTKVRKAFVETFKQPFPQPQEGEVTQTHNLALRTGHDFLPGQVKFNGEYVNVFTLTGHGDKFSKSEMRQPSSPLDGEFDEEFLGIDVCVNPPGCSFIIQVNLLEADVGFAEQFDTQFSFEHFMEETSDGRYDANEDVTKLIIELFPRGTYLD